MNIPVSKLHPISAMLLVFTTALAVGGIFGTIINMINGLVSPLYYRLILGWSFKLSVWNQAVLQGFYKGLIYGAVYSFFFYNMLYHCC